MMMMMMIVNNYKHIYRNTQHTMCHSCVIFADVRTAATLGVI